MLITILWKLMIILAACPKGGSAGNWTIISTLTNYERSGNWANGRVVVTAKQSPAHTQMALESAEQRSLLLASKAGPSAVVDLRAVSIQSRSVQLEWEVVDKSARSYTVFYKLVDSARERMVNTSTKGTTVNLLEPSTEYTFRVVASDGHGVGETSESITASTTKELEVPKAVTNLRGAATSSTGIELKWGKPEGDMPITYYKLYYSLGNAQGGKETEIQHSGTSYTLVGLEAYTAYTFRVEAFGSKGVGESSPPLTVRTASSLPTASPRRVQVDPMSTNQVLVQWQPPPTGDRNGEITGYRVKYKLRRRGSNTLSKVVAPSDRKLTISQLAPSSTYVVRVQAINVNGSGPYSEWTKVDTFAKAQEEDSVPGAPTSLRLQPDQDSISLTWTPPQDGGVMVRGYIINWGVGVPDTNQQKVDANERYYQITGLDSNRQYVIKLCAYNRAGNGFPIFESERTTMPRLAFEEGDDYDGWEEEHEMSTPVGVHSDTLDSNIIRVMWTDQDLPPARGGVPQRPHDGRFYTVRYTSYRAVEGAVYKHVNSTETTALLNDLVPFTQYEMSVKIVFGKMESPWSMASLNTTQSAVPTSAPRDVTISAAVDEGHPDRQGNQVPTAAVRINWQLPKFPNGIIDEYLIYYVTNLRASQEEWEIAKVLGESLTTVVGGLRADTKYYFKVQARNDKGYSPLSQPRSIRTPSRYQLVSGTTNDESSAGRSSSSFPLDLKQPPVLIALASIIAVLVLILCIVIVCCCHRRRGGHRGRGGYTQGKKTDVKPPPDLWIDHQHVDQERRQRNTPNDSMADLKLYAATSPDHDARYGTLAELGHGSPLIMSTSSARARETSTPISTSQLSTGRRYNTPSRPLLAVHASRLCHQDSGIATSEEADSGGTLSRSYHNQSAGSSIDLLPPSGRHRSTPHVVYTGPRGSSQGAPPPPPQQTMLTDYGTHTSRHSPYQSTVGLTPTPPPNMGTLTKRSTGGGHPLSSFSGMVAPPPPCVSNNSTISSPRMHVVRPINTRSTPNCIAMSNIAPHKTATVLPNSARVSQMPNGNAMASVSDEMSGKDTDSDLQHSYSTEELNAQMHNLDNMIDDLQAMQAEFTKTP